MAIRYVRTDGHDTASGANDTSDPTTGAWLTIKYANATIASGDTVNIGAGTYAEDSGSGYLYLTRGFTSDTVFQSTSGNADDVIIKAASSSSYNTLMGGATPIKYYHFKNLTFQNRVTGSPPVRISRCDVGPITFTTCKISLISNSTAAGFDFGPTTSSTVNNIIFDTCDVSQQNTGGSGGGFVGILGAGTAITNINITNCTVNVPGTTVYTRQSGTGVTITNGIFTTTGSSTAMWIDRAAPSVTGATINSANYSPAGIYTFGSASATSGGTFTNCIVSAGAEAFKAAVNVANMTISGGSYTSTGTGKYAIVIDGSATACNNITLLNVTAKSPLLPPQIIQTVTNLSDTGGTYSVIPPPPLPSIYADFTNGHDDTEAGTLANPYKTITKSLSMAVNGQGILLQAGTYLEGTTIFDIQNVFSTAVTVESVSGNPADVIIMGNNSVYNTYFRNNASGITFKNVTFSPKAATDLNAIRMLAANNITFTGCVFAGEVATTNYLVNLSQVTTNNIYNITFTNCTFNATGASNTCLNIGLVSGTTHDITVTNPTMTSVGGPCLNASVNAGYTMSNLTFTGGTYTQSAGGGGAFWIGPSAGTVDTVTISGLIVNAYQGGVALQGGLSHCTVTNVNTTTTTGRGFTVGGDSDPGYNTTTTTLSNCNIYSANSHGLLIGWRCTGVTATNCTVHGGDYPLVLKEGTNNIVSNSSISGGTSATVYNKAGTGNITTGCTILNTVGGRVHQIDWNNVGNNLVTNCQFINNKVIVRGTGYLYYWYTEGDGGGNISNNNVYDVGTTNVHPFGNILGTNCDTLPAVRAFWAGYSVPTNDNKSRFKTHDDAQNKLLLNP